MNDDIKLTMDNAQPNDPTQQVKLDDAVQAAQDAVSDAVKSTGDQISSVVTDVANAATNISADALKAAGETVSGISAAVQNAVKAEAAQAMPDVPAAAQMAQDATKISDIKLSLDTMPTPTAPGVAPVAADEKPLPTVAQVESKFTPAENQMINDFSKKIDVTDPNLVFSYGASAQQKIASFSDSALKNVQTKDLGEVGDMIGGLVTELRNFTDIDEKKGGILGFFKKNIDKLTMIKAKFDATEVNVNKIVDALQAHQVQLLKDIATLDQLYEENLRYFKELSMYIEAGKRRLADVRATDVIAAQNKAKQSNLPEDAQAANDLVAKCDRFEKKLYDLELTRNISLQMAPQIRLLQNSNQLMAEKIQSTLVNTIPLWKSQMVLALGMHHSQDAMEAQRAVTDLTNEMLKKNADALHMATVETAKESERGIVDIETLTQTNQQLINTMDEVLNIQQEGREKRRAAEQELQNIEAQLKAKLLEVRN